MPEPIHPQTTIGHVHLKVANIERAVKFYTEVLGFEVQQRWGDSAAFLSAEQGAFAVRHQDDDSGVDSRELLIAARRIRAFEHVTALPRQGRRAASAAESMAFAPMQHRASVSQQARFVRRQLSGDQSQVMELRVGGQRRRLFAVNLDGERRALAESSEQNDVGT